ISPREGGKSLALLSRKIDYAYWTELAHPDIRDAYGLMQDLQRQREQLIEAFPTTMVMQELPEPRETHMLIRGAYDRPGERVFPGTPAVLQVPLSVGEADFSRTASLFSQDDNTAKRAMPEPNRLTFARWIVDPKNP